jgi:DNA-binding phage protein
MFRSYDDRRKFASDVLEASFFGAFVMAIDARKNELNMTQAELAERTGREKTGISKLLSGPRNWTIRTISDLAEALDLRLEFALIDRINPVRRFTASGVQCDVSHVGQPVNCYNASFPAQSAGGVVMGQVLMPVAPVNVPYSSFSSANAVTHFGITLAGSSNFDPQYGILIVEATHRSPPHSLKKAVA